MLKYFSLENMDRIKVEPDSHEECSLTGHSEGNFICIKEEYLPEELFSSQDPENVSFKSSLYLHTQKVPQHKFYHVENVHPLGHPTCVIM
jgi:hypothetical protein